MHFPSTLWTDLQAIRDPGEIEKRLHRLVEAYWKPIYQFIRRIRGRSHDEAKDLTQSFFVHLMEGDRLVRSIAGVRSFRAYLKTALRNFLANVERDAAAQKRGGSHLFFPFDEIAQEPMAQDTDPDAVFDHEWARNVLKASVDGLKQRLEKEGKEVYFQAFRLYSDGQAYRDVARSLSISESDVRNYLTYARQILRRIVCEQIRDYVQADGDVEDEVRFLLSLLRS